MDKKKESNNWLIMNNNRNKPEKDKTDHSKVNKKESSRKVIGMTIINKERKLTNKKEEKCKNKTRKITKRMTSLDSQFQERYRRNKENKKYSQEKVKMIKKTKKIKIK